MVLPQGGVHLFQGGVLPPPGGVLPPLRGGWINPWSHPPVLTQGRSRPCHVVDCLVDDTLMQTRPDGAAIRRR